MKEVLYFCASVVVLAVPAAAAEYTVFRVCEDHRVLHTADGADAGHVEYIVVECASNRVAAAVVTGGVLNDRRVTIPIAAIGIGLEREVILQGISRRELMAAPEFEVPTRGTMAVVEPTLIEHAFAHFGYDPADIGRSDSTLEAAGNRESRQVRGTRSSAATEGVSGGADAQRPSRNDRGRNEASAGRDRPNRDGR